MSETTAHPKFVHDCEDCIFLGTWIGPVFADDDDRQMVWDLYYHRVPGSLRDTVIARYGSDGSQYQSGMSFAEKDSIQPLYEARLRAEAKGLRLR